jgi:hypothetical protein
VISEHGSGDMVVASKSFQICGIDQVGQTGVQFGFVADIDETAFHLVVMVDGAHRFRVDFARLLP